MTPVGTELDAAVRLAVAALIGLGVGVERQWSGHATGPNARFAGLRTFFLLGILGGTAGLLLSVGFVAAGAVVIAGGLAFGVSAYVVTTRRAHMDIEGTTEAAALAVVVLGAVAGGGWLVLAAGAGAIIVLALSEKARLHWLVQRVGERELHAALQFAAMALVILPLLPAGPFGGVLAIRPRAVWAIVLFFSALNFVGYLARRAVGDDAGHTVTGVLGGLLSSTGVTFDFARKSRLHPEFGRSLAYGVIGACTVLLFRVTIMSVALNPGVALRLSGLLWLPALAGAAMVWRGWRRDNGAPRTNAASAESPLRLGIAMQMAVAFQVAMTAIELVQDRWGTMGLYPTAGVLGLTDMDALTVSMNRIDGDVPPSVAAQAIAIGIIANSLLKMGVAAGIGGGQFRRIAVAGLGVLALASGAGLALVMFRG